MSYNILGINTSHNGSVCVLKDGEIDFFLEEERLSLHKLDTLPLKGLKYISENYSIDEISLAGLSQNLDSDKFLELLLLTLSLLFPKVAINNLLEHHHLSHIASSFFNSKFKKCLGIVIDGNGSCINTKSPYQFQVETESCFLLDIQTLPQCIYKSNRLMDFSKPTLKSREKLSLTKVYETITTSLGFQWFESGKTMGLSSYGKYNSNIPPLYIGSKGNKKILNSFWNNTTGSLKTKYNFLLSSEDLRKDLAFKVQQESQQAVGDLIEKGLKETKLKQVCCAGGYFLNCVTNYYLTKRFPDIEFYFEPISSDAGVSIGAAKLIWYRNTRDTTIRPQKTLYYGPKYSKEELLKGIKKYI